MPAQRVIRSSKIRRLAMLAIAASLGSAQANDPSFFCGGAPLTDQGYAQRSFGAWQDNFALAEWTRDPGWNERSERAFHGQFSVKYTVAGEHYSRIQERRGKTRPAASECAEFFVAYTGAFDFYLNSRPSSPVVGRIHNPGAFLRIPLRRLWAGAGRDDQLHISLEHLSNGQTLDAGTADGSLRVMRAYEQRNRSVLDSISRGGNFVGVDAASAGTAFGRPIDLRAKLKLHFGGDENRIEWGPDVDRLLRDYDVLLLQAGVSLGWWGRFELDWRLGQLGLRGDSVALGWQRQILGFPVYARLHDGPMGTLANFSQRQRKVGVGFRFAFD